MIFHVDLSSKAALRKLCVNFGISFDAFDHFNNFSIPALECELGYEIVKPELAEENNSESLEIIGLLERLDSILSEFQPTAESSVSRDDATSIASGICACSLETWTC